MTLETLTEHMRDVWLGELIEGSFGASPDRIRRWAFRSLLRVTAVVLVFGTPWALSLSSNARIGWVGATGLITLLSAWASRNSCRTRSLAFLSYGLYVVLACPIVAGLSRSSASLWMPLVLTLFGVAAYCGYRAQARTDKRAA